MRETSPRTVAGPAGESVPVVALGSCAGGLESILAILAKLPSDCGMALVVIQHLDPVRRSVLRGLRSHGTAFPVLEISNRLTVQPNHIYVVPPNKRASIRGGTFSLGPITSRDPYQPINDFMEDLAAARGHKAVGVLLSGVGSDGTFGLAAIKAAGGITFAQDPKTARWPAMPLSAINAGNVDFVLSPARIALDLGRLETARQRKYAREGQAESEEFAAAIIGAVLDPIVVMDGGGHILEFNPAAERMFGYRKEDVLGHELADKLIAPSLREEHQRGLAHYFATGEGPLMGTRMSIVGMRADGSELPIELSIARTGLRIPVFVGLMRETSERQPAEADLFESEEHFRNIADNAPVLLWTTGPDKLCTWVNKHWLSFVGRTMAQELGNGWAENVHPEDLDRCLHIYTTRFDAREVFSMEYRLRRHDGQWRWILDNGTPRYDSNKNFVGYIGSCSDITSLKLLQDQQIMVDQKLRQRESELSALFDSSPDPHLRFDSNIRVTHGNTAFQKASGIPLQLIVGKTGRELPFLQADVKIGHDLIRQVFQTGQPRQHEFIVQSAEGVTQHEVRYVPEWSPDGSVAAVLAIGRDITERKQMEQALRQRESALSALFDGSPDSHARFDSNLRVTHANAAFEKAMGVSVQTLIGKTVHQLPLSEYNRRISDVLINKVFRTGQSQRYEFSVVSTEGVMEYEVRYVPELSSDGSVAAVQGIGRDITERKQMEQALRQREQELATLFNNSPDVIVRRDRSLRHLYVNATWERLTGIARDMALGKTSEELGLQQATVKLQTRAIRQVLKTQSPLTIEFTYPSPSGPVEHEVRHIPEFGTGGVSSILSIGRDVTEQKRLQKVAAANERDIRALSASLITAQEQERRRIAREIHDSLLQHLGSLAAEIGGIASELPASSSAGPRLQAARERALRTAEEVREIARRLHPSVLEDLGLPKALGSLCHEFSQRHGILVKFRAIDPLPEAPLEVASCVYRIAQEALNNVAKHAHAKNVRVRLSGHGNLHLLIHDDGIGFKADSVRGAGGLGLVSMQERARIAGAKLSIRGSPGHGTRVDLVAPIRGATREKSAHSAGR